MNSDERSATGKQAKRTCQKLLIAVLGGCCLLFLAYDFSLALDSRRVKPRGRPATEQPLPSLEEKKPLPPPKLYLPAPSPPPAEGKKRGAGPGVRVFVKKIEVVGSTVFSAAELDRITKPYVNRELTTEDLDSLRQALTVYYIKHGYINSGAVIPDQEVKDGIIRVQIVEGRLTAIEVQGNRWFADGFLKRRLALGVEQPLNIEALQRRLQLLQQQPLIERLHGALKPGPAPGESVLLVQVEEQQPFEITLGFDNYQSPTVGAEEGWVTIADRNLFGYGDALSLGYGASEGAEPQWDFSYTLPFTAYDTTLILRCRKNKFKVVESPFDSLNVETKSEIYSLGIRQPVYRSLNHEVVLSLVGEHSRDRTYLLGERFSFYPGEENGKAIVTALRFAQEWVYHTQKQVIAARSQFSFGLDTLHATTNSGDTPDGRFLAWLGQFQWARVVSPWDIQLLWRTDLQLANDSLLPLEQIAIGGRYSVRGYRENQLVRDQGLIASLEARIPLVQHAVWAEYLQLVPFVDYGRGWNRDLDTPPVKHISSVGLGLRWAASWRRAPLTLRPQLEVYWGIPLRDVDNPDNDLQDDGLHLQFTLSCF